MEDNEGNWTNIIGVLRFEKLEYEGVRQLIFERLKNVGRCRSKMIKLFGIWYFKRMDDEEFESKKDVVVRKLEGIHTDLQLSEWMCKEQVKRDPMDNVPYRFWIVPDFKEDESIMILKVHHSFSDGIGIFTMMSMLQENPSVDDL